MDGAKIHLNFVYKFCDWNWHHTWLIEHWDWETFFRLAMKSISRNIDFVVYLRWEVDILKEYIYILILTMGNFIKSNKIILGICQLKLVCGFWCYFHRPFKWEIFFTFSFRIPLNVVNSFSMKSQSWINCI